jgi:ribose transport system substrate-binding protein
MHKTKPRRARWRTAPILAAGLAIGVALVFAGFAAAAPTAETASSGLAHAQAAVKQLEKVTNKFTAPGSKLNVRSLKGKTIFYIPITLEDPEFAIVSASLKQALAKAGVKLQTCNGNSDPSAISACLNQAVSSHAAGVICDSIPIVLADTAFTAVENAGIPIVISDQIVPPASYHLPGTVSGIGNDQLSYFLANGTGPLVGIADWIIADSKGSANVLISQFTDSFSTEAYVQGGTIPQFKQYCPGCTTALSDVTNANFGLIPSQTSSALLSDPNTNYVLSEFDAELQVVYGGVQSAGDATKVKGASTGGILGALQMIKSKTYLDADLGTDFPYQGWADADQIFRMILHKPIVTEKVPSRLFTSANIRSVKLTSAAEDSGVWYGSLAWQSMFKKLWGLG